MTYHAARLPELEGRLTSGQPGRAHLIAGGPQSFCLEQDGIQVAGYGRLRFLSPEWVDASRALGPAAALLRAWQDRGADCLSQLGGEYLVSIWDSRNQRGLAAVDRFSTFSLYWGEKGGRVAFATRPGRVCELLEIARELDPRAVHAYTYFHMIPAPLSIHRHVSRLDIGQMLAIDRGAASLKTHWSPRFQEDLPFDFGTEREAFMAGLREGVAECVDGVPRERLGCFLSGGTDSSTIAGLVTEAYQAPARTFSIGFDVSDYDERQYSRIAASHFGTEHTEHVLTPAEAEDAIDLLASTYEQPFGNASAVPTYVCSRIAREAGVSRMLGGDGGDELYGGNERYATQWLFSLYGQLPGVIRKGALEPLLFGPLAGVQAWPLGKARSYIEQANVPLPDRLGAKYNLLNRFGASRVFSEEMMAGSGAFDPVSIEREVYARSDARSQINRLLAYDFKFTLGDNDLPKVVRMCHAAGVEVAFPMLTRTLTDHSLRLAPGQKLKGRRLRYFFKESLRGFLPDAILEKSKHGFGMPFGEWLLAQPRLSEKVLDALKGLEGRGVIRQGFLSEVDQATRSGHAGYYGTMIWVLMTLELWMRAHTPSQHSEPVVA